MVTDRAPDVSEENEILRDVCQAEEQMEAGQGIPHAEAKAQVMAALKR